MDIWMQLEDAERGERWPLEAVIAAMPWNADGLITAIAQQHDSGEVLMLAWMNREALLETLDTGRVCYWSRSRQGPACHTRRPNCFYNAIRDGSVEVITAPLSP
ncbi:phosphoribosyl-AMP cyclohydrolase [Halomonas organivorans]